MTVPNWKLLQPPHVVTIRPQTCVTGRLNLKLSAQKLLRCKAAGFPSLPSLCSPLPCNALLHASLHGPTCTFSSSPAPTDVEGFGVNLKPLYLWNGRPMV